MVHMTEKALGRLYVLANATVATVAAGFILAACVSGAGNGPEMQEMPVTTACVAVSAAPVVTPQTSETGKSDRTDRATAARVRAGAPVATPEATDPADEEEAAATPRYAPVTEEEREIIARIVQLEAGGECAEGQQAVAEVILNRRAADNFPDTVEEVVYQGCGEGVQQFTSASYLDTARPTQAQYDAVDAALKGEAVLPTDVVYFNTEPENDRVWGQIGGHVFCRQYDWAA